MQATNGNLYGTTTSGGGNENAHSCSYGCGTVFEINPAGKLTTLYSFCSQIKCADGVLPDTALVQATNGDFYGTTPRGGANCTIYAGCGTASEITAAGALTTLHSFCTPNLCADGSYPNGPLVQATDGKFYGTTEFGGEADEDVGTAFEITSTGALTTLYDFCSVGGCADGIEPVAGLLQATDGTFYGTTLYGGADYEGTVFSLATGLGPFVSFVPNAAKAGQQFSIFGYGLAHATSVSLDGIRAGFTVKSDTLLIATVPEGATRGYVSVSTPGGRLASNVPFHVIP